MKAIQTHFQKHIERDMEDLQYRSHETHSSKHLRVNSEDFLACVAQCFPESVPTVSLANIAPQPDAANGIAGLESCGWHCLGLPFSFGPQQDAMVARRVRVAADRHRYPKDSNESHFLKTTA